MATTLNLSSTYAGKELQEVLTPMFEGMHEVMNGDVTLHNDVNYKKALRRMTVDGILGAETAAFTPTGTVNLDEKILFPTIQEVNLQLDKDDFRSEWASARMGEGQLTKVMAKEITDGVVKNILGKVGAGVRVSMWNAAVGSAYNQLPAGGLYTQIAAAVEATTTGSDAARPGFETYAAITATNVVAKLSGVLAAMKPEALDFDKTRLFIASDVWFAYTQAVGDQANMRSSVERLEPMFNGYKVVVVKELAASTIIAANKDNLHFGTDIFSDMAYVEVIDLSHTTGDRYLRYIQKVAIDVKVAFTEETAIHANLTPGVEV